MNTPTGGFLCDFVEGRIEKPSDGLNGDCIIHYTGQYSDYLMKVKLVNGMREGEALIVQEDSPYIKLEYRNGKMTGAVKRMKLDGTVELMGELIDGMESGLFKEYLGECYNRRHIYCSERYLKERTSRRARYVLHRLSFDDCEDGTIWRGYYRNGKRYSEVRKNGRGGKWYEERSMKNRELLSIAEYDSSLHDKNGRCMEYENGKWVGEWVYENGVRVRCMREYRDGVITLYDDNGEKVTTTNEWDGMRMRETLHSVMKDKNDDSLMYFDLKTGYVCGVWKTKERCYVLQRSDEENQVVVADLKTHEMRVYDGDDWKESEQDGVSCVDLGVSGRRWEGGIKDGKPFGYGVLYDEEGKKEYEGFIIDEMRICYGTEYYSGIERVEYVGCIFDSKRFGKGVCYDRNGIIEYDGLWNSDELHSDQLDDGMMNNYTESIGTGERTFNDVKSFIPPVFLHSLKQIVIGNECYKRVRVFELDGLSELESVKIGKESYSMNPSDPWRTKRADGFFRIVNCSELKSIQIGRYSFSDYRSFELSNLPSLQFIDIDIECFKYVRSFSLVGLVDLNGLNFQIFLNFDQSNSDTVHSMRYIQLCLRVVEIWTDYEDLPKLQSIQLGSYVFGGDENQKTISDKPYNYKNSLTMRSKRMS